MKINIEKMILIIQSSNKIEEIWLLILEMFKTENIYKGSYLIVKSPFKHKKYFFKKKKILTEELNSDVFNFENVDFKDKGYLFDEKEKKISGHLRLSFSEIEFVINLDKSNFTAFQQFDKHNLIISFFVNHLNLLLHVNHLSMHSIKDDLTLLYNQNYLKSFIEREISRSKRFGLQFSVIFFDLDYLKDINEEHGHLVGTEVLKEVSRILKDSIRTFDVVARFGGDEFVIVLSDSAPDLALKISKRLREKIINNSFLEKDGLDLKISGCFGIANFPEHGDSVKDLIKKSDMAMYEVKRSGKNGIMVYKGD